MPPLRIAIDITHPVHVHMFRNAIREWEARGHDLMILSRDKDLVVPLLDEFGLRHRCLTVAGKGLPGLATELGVRFARTWKALGKHGSDVAVAAGGGPYIAPPARLRGIPAVVFYDFEGVWSNRIGYPAAETVYTPRAYRGDIGGKHKRYDGYQPLAYLHPKRFTPDPSKLASEGLAEGEPFTYVRAVAWASHHDVGASGITDLREIVTRLSRHGRVIISSETPLPEDLEQYARKSPSKDVHHIMAFARLMFGESSTMATEAALLGVPAVFLSSSDRSFTNELEERYQLVFNFTGDRAVQASALDRAEAILGDPSSAGTFAHRREVMMSELVDLTDVMVDHVESYAEPMRGSGRRHAK